jgi:hypothetical protein
MTVSEPRPRLGTSAIPRPRESRDDAPDAAPGRTPPTMGEFPWPEPWHLSRGARPRSEYWDVATAGWHSRGPLVPRRGD